MDGSTVDVNKKVPVSLAFIGLHNSNSNWNASGMQAEY